MLMNPSVKTNCKGFDAIQEALTLSGNPEKLQAYYDKWAVAYDRDVSAEKYIGWLTDKS